MIFKESWTYFAIQLYTKKIINKNPIKHVALAEQCLIEFVS
jgi:hypothetical protein